MTIKYGGDRDGGTDSGCWTAGHGCYHVDGPVCVLDHGERKRGSFARRGLYPPGRARRGAA